MYCPPSETLQQFINHELPEELRIRIQSHIKVCIKCQREIDFLFEVKHRTDFREHILSSGINNTCLSDEEIIEYLDSSELNAELRPKLRHLMNCEYCLNRLNLLRSTIHEITSEEINIPSKIARRVKSMQNLNRPGIKPVSLFKYYRKLVQQQKRSRIPSWQSGLTLIFLLFVLFAIYNFFSAAKYAPDSPSLGKTIILKSPNNLIQTKCPEFKWEGVIGIREYIIKLKSLESGDIIWQACTPNTRIHYPHNAKRQLKTRTNYSWDVSARTPAGNLINSNLLSFTIADNLD